MANSPDQVKMRPGDVFLCPFFVRNPLRYRGSKCGDVRLRNHTEVFQHVVFHLRHPAECITLPSPASQPPSDQPNDGLALAIEKYRWDRLDVLGDPATDPFSWYKELWGLLFCNGPAPNGIAYVLRHMPSSRSLVWYFLEENMHEKEVHWMIREFTWQVRPELSEWDRARFMPVAGPGSLNVFTGPSYTCPLYLHDPGKYMGPLCGDRLMPRLDSFFDHICVEHANELSAATVQTVRQIQNAAKNLQLITIEWWGDTWTAIFGQATSDEGRPGNYNYTGYGAHSYLWQFRHGLYPNSIPFFLLAENSNLNRPHRRPLSSTKPKWMIEPAPMDARLPAFLWREIMQRRQREARKEARKGGVETGQPSSGQAGSQNLTPSSPNTQTSTTTGQGFLQSSTNLNVESATYSQGPQSSSTNVNVWTASDAA